MNSWDDIRLFAQVARCGGLAAAAPVTGSSPPTLGRRITRLEREIGRDLFVRNRLGYSLTEAGEELLALAEQAELAVSSIDQWRQSGEPQPVVRIAAGPWMTGFLATRIAELTEMSACTIELISGTTPVDLMRREAQIGLRNQRPDGRGLAGRRLVSVEFAVYRQRQESATTPRPVSKLDLPATAWIELASPGPPTPSSLWLHRLRGRPASIRLPTTQSVLAAVSAGAGVTVLPCFIGDRQQTLERYSTAITELAHDQWLVAHDKDRHHRPVRITIDALAKLIQRERALFAGQAAR